MQKVETEENPPLKQEEEETDTVPDDPSLFNWEAAVPIIHCFCCHAKTHTNAHTHRERERESNRDAIKYNDK